jgi:hypothetical protein
MIKKEFLLFTVIILSLEGTAQSDLFSKTFGTSENDFAYSSLQARDGGYMVAGQIGIPNNGLTAIPDAWIIKLDKQGNKEWDRRYGGKEADVVFSLETTKDSGYISAGTTSSFGKNYPSMWILKLNAKGDTLWTRVFEGSIVSQARSAKQTSDGGYITAGKGFENILKLDQNGKKEWGKRYSWIFYDICQTADGGYITVGDSIYQQLNWDYIPVLTVFKLDKNGNKEWSNPLGNKFLGRAYAVRQTADNGYIIAGDSLASKSPTEYSHFAMALKLRSDGKVEWKYFGKEHSEFQSVETKKNGENVFAGNLTDPDYGLDVLVTLVDGNGKGKWTKNFGKSGGWEYAASIRQTSEGGFIVAAHTDAWGAGKYDAWILKLDANGNGNLPTGIDIPGWPSPDEMSMTIFPNPAPRKTTIGISLLRSKHVALEVCDISGKAVFSVFSGLLPQGLTEISWNATGMADGLYLCRLKAGQNTMTRKFIVYTPVK